MQLSPKSLGWSTSPQGRCPWRAFCARGYREQPFSASRGKSKQGVPVCYARQFAAAQPITSSMHLAWFMVSKSVAHALSYDARLVPSPVLGTVAEPVSSCVEDLAHFLMHGGTLPSCTDDQLRLPGAYGGMGLRREAEGLMADAALWAAWVSMSVRVPQLAQSLGLTVGTCAGETAANAAKSRLEGAGVLVDTLGGVKFTQAACEEYAAGPWHVGGPCSRPTGGAAATARSNAPGSGAGGLATQATKAPRPQSFSPP